MVLRDTWQGDEDRGAKETVRIGRCGQCARDMLGRRSGPFRGACWLPVLVEIISEGGDSSEKRGSAGYCGNRSEITHTHQISSAAEPFTHVIFDVYEARLKVIMSPIFLVIVTVGEDSQQILRGENSIKAMQSKGVSQQCNEA